MFIFVYQAKSKNGQGSLNDFTYDRNPHNLELGEAVAIVLVRDDIPLIGQLEMAYESTNSVDWSWWQNGNVYTNRSDQNPCRSTTTGDVLEIDGKRWIVDSCGFVSWEVAEYEFEMEQLKIRLRNKMGERLESVS